jgi:hypothetical protein
MKRASNTYYKKYKGWIMNKLFLVLFLPVLTPLIQCMDSHDYTPFLEELSVVPDNYYQNDDNKNSSEKECAETTSHEPPLTNAKKRTRTYDIERPAIQSKKIVSYSKSFKALTAKQLFSRFLRPAIPSDWSTIQNRKYRAICPEPICDYQAEEVTIASLIPKITSHLLNAETKGHDDVDIYEIQHTLIANTFSDLQVQCIEPDCNYQGSKLYFTLMESFKALHSHYSNYHPQLAFSHEKIKQNIQDSEQSKKYILIREKPVSNKA